MIRFAEKSDIPRIVELGSLSLLDGPYRSIIGDVPKVTEKLADFVIDSGKVTVWDEDGAIRGLLAFVVFPHYFTGEPTANEIIWYVEREYRGKASLELLWAAEKAAYEMGAVRMQLTAPTPEVGKIYEHCHYHMVEIGYQADLAERVKH